MLELILLVLFLVILALIAIAFFLFKKAASLEHSLEELQSRKASQSVRYGQLTEQWIPFTKDFPFNPEDFHFLGKPVDGIVFDPDQIVFCEFKTNKSQLNQKQKIIKELVKNKKISWLEYRID